MDRYGKAIPLFDGKYEWFPASRCVFIAGTTQLIARDCFNSQQAREAIQDWWAKCAEEKKVG